MFYIKYLFFFFLYFFLHYIEGLPTTGSLSIAQIWKIPLLLYFIFINIRISRKRKRFEYLGYLYSLEAFLCPAFIASPLPVITFASKQLPLVLSFGFWMSTFKGNVNKLETILYSLVQFICLSSFLTLTGLVKPLKDAVSAEAFIEGLSYYGGVFGVPHAAASYFVIAIIVLSTGFFLGRFKKTSTKIFNLFLIGIAFVSLFHSYVRTGWLMLLVSFVFYANFKKISIRRMMLYICSALLAAGGLIYLYNTNDAFRVRVTGERRYGPSNEQAIELEGSGRNGFWINGIENWADNDTYGFFFGKGQEEVLKDNKRAFGMRVFSHNLFIDSLAQYGLVSLSLLLAFYWSLHKFIKLRGRGSPYQKMCISIYWSSVIFSFFQSEIYFDYAIIFSLSLCIMNNTSIYSHNFLNTKQFFTKA